MTSWTKVFVVEGHWPFPTDMLRYDRCEPAEEADKVIIDRLSEDHPASLSMMRERVQVNLRITGERGFVYTSPTAARWDSFNWRVVEHGTPQRAA